MLSTENVVIADSSNLWRNHEKFVCCASEGQLFSTYTFKQAFTFDILISVITRTTTQTRQWNFCSAWQRTSWLRLSRQDYTRSSSWKVQLPPAIWSVLPHLSTSTVKPTIMTNFLHEALVNLHVALLLETLPLSWNNRQTAMSFLLYVYIFIYCN